MSELSIAEHMLININWITQTDDNFQCKKIEDIYSNRKDAETVINYRRITNGCGVISNNIKVEIDGVGIYTCPCHNNFKIYDFNNIYWMHDMYKKGLLGFSGSLMDQPSKYVQIMQLLDKLYLEYEAEVNKKQSKDK